MQLIGEMITIAETSEVPVNVAVMYQEWLRQSGRSDMGDELTQRGVSDAEFIDELREPRRRNSPSDPTSREIEVHVLTGHASFRSWYAACVQGRGRAERHHGEGRKELEDSSKVPPSRIVGLLFPWSQKPNQ